MEPRGDRSGLGGRLLLLLLCVGALPALYLVRRPPQHFSPPTWRTAEPTNRLAMARDFVTRGTWRGASSSDLRAWLGEPWDTVTQMSWSLPGWLTKLMADKASEGSVPIDRPRLVVDSTSGCFRMTVDRGERNADDAHELLHIHARAVVTVPRPRTWLSAALAAAVLRATSETRTNLSWLAETGGFLHEAAILQVTLADDRANDAQVCLR
ncbi:MAG TPA: hypothetical protein VK824_02090 [Planctomycetota bacterium]|nr:hypothetical protein [Planctomycetota bacterium]